MAPGPFALMRKNLKKSIFFLTASNGALWYTYDYSITNDVMKTASRRAVEYGDQKLRNFNSKPRHITVILNPVAGKRKSKKLYTKWVEPLLHLAGIKVSLIETDSPNQAYNLMKIMSNCDGVAIVGGDGTVNEALNGLLSRPDASKVSREIPIAIIPTGQYNSIARYIHQKLVYRNQKELLIHSTWRLIDSTTEKHDVLKITALDQETREKEGPTYALRDVRYGKYQDNFVKVSGYLFYQINIKPLWLRIQSALTNKFPKPRIESILYTNPCSGCSRCYKKHKLEDAQPIAIEEKSANQRWWGVLAPISKKTVVPTEEEKKDLESSKKDNPKCDKWMNYGVTSDVTDFRACMMGDKQIRLSIGSRGEYTASEIFETQDVKLKVASDLDVSKNLGFQTSLKEQQVEEEPNESGEKSGDKDDKEDKDTSVKFLIDGQPKQAHSIEITTLHKAVTVFTGTLKLY